MNKIILNVGLLVFFLSIIFFSQRQLPVADVLIRSLTIFIFATGALAIIGIIFIRSINKKSMSKHNNVSENISGS